MVEDIRPEAAVRAAKQWLAHIYADEAIDNIGLEEVRLRDGNWEITLGFNRRNEPAPSAGVSAPANPSLAAANPLASALRSVASQRRVYKVIVVAGNDNHVTEMRDREVALRLQKTLALDAHLLMLLAVGAVNVAYIAKHKRLLHYRTEHFEVLRELVDQAPAAASTTHALTEASNLLRQCRDPMRSEIMTALAGIVAVIEELTPAAREVCETAEFLRLGLTDAAFALLDPDRYRVISADFDLIVALGMRGFEVEYFHSQLFD